MVTHFNYAYNNGTKDTALVTQRQENDPGSGGATVTVTYSYDALNRLISAVASSGTSYYYTYDAAGNRTCAQTTACSGSTYSYNSANELTTGPAGSYSYDADGNETASPQLTTLAYNNRNQTSSITPSGSGAQTYSYTGSDSTQRTAAGSTTFAPQGRQILQATTAGASIYYIYDPSGNLLGERVSGTSYYDLHDNLGSVIAVIDNSGTVSDRYSYDPYGVQTVQTSGVANPWGYAGGYIDSATGLVKFGTRYYDATTGRWTQPDAKSGELAEAQSLDKYAYAGDDPTNVVDLTGLSWWNPTSWSSSTWTDIGIGAIGLGIAVASFGWLAPAGMGASLSLIEGTYSTLDVAGALATVGGGTFAGTVGAGIVIGANV